MFRDITPVLKDAGGFKAAIDLFVERFKHEKIDHIVAIEARGYMLGAPLAYALGTGFVPVRKPGKLPGTKHVEEYAPLLDAWEVANRDDIFNPVGLRKLPFIASSDFHKPKHIHSWKTVLYCEKEAEAIKHCIRVNRDVSITLYRDHRFALDEQPAMEKGAEVVDFAAATQLAKRG